MENLDLIILTIIAVVFFIAFFISTFKAYEYASKLDNPENEKQGIVARLIAYIESITEN
ncbi:hypothetical protein [Flavobacterium lacus]|uniref:Uncharacterized protein n=1 Tax=Flavobacterium lacus TaxID=1353778 RepID=A0A328WS51_9FLAO|nr:hypothetical protein [Flavobacterium lacus]RAR46684.1 hypothetical protein B0I10_11688 [Flavobacterium lacus]